MRVVVPFAMLFVALAWAELVRAAQLGRTVDEACQLLRTHMAKVEEIPGGSPPKQWYCDYSSWGDPKYYIMALRYSDSTRPPSEMYSNLIGWFAVSKTTTVVKEWDINMGRAIPISREYYGFAKRKK